MTQLTGKIYWVESDFLFNQVWEPKKGETSLTITTVENVIIDKELIRFSTKPYNYGGETLSYNVNLTPETYFKFSGNFTEISDRDWSGPVSCELFYNEKTYFLYGKWTEDEQVYTWWARIDKTQT